MGLFLFFGILLKVGATAKPGTRTWVHSETSHTRSVDQESCPPAAPLDPVHPGQHPVSTRFSPSLCMCTNYVLHVFRVAYSLCAPHATLTPLLLAPLPGRPFCGRPFCGRSPFAFQSSSIHNKAQRALHCIYIYYIAELHSEQYSIWWPP
jgi:hypothetical protein